MIKKLNCRTIAKGLPKVNLTLFSVIFCSLTPCIKYRRLLPDTRRYKLLFREYIGEAGSSVCSSPLLDY